MITARFSDQGRLVELALAPGDPVPAGAVWIDLLRPSEEERLYANVALGLDLPNAEEMQEIEASSRLYTENGAAYMTAPLVSRADTDDPESKAVTFVLTPDRLVTLRLTEPRAFESFAARAQKQPELLATPADALVGLLESVVDRLADVLERVGGDLDGLSRRIFRAQAAKANRKTVDLQDAVQRIGADGDLTAKVRISLAGLDRLHAFLIVVLERQSLEPQRESLRTLGRDLRSIIEHAGFLSSQVGFLLDATLGLINIEQTNIVKTFSVAAVAFLPPTLIASIYGMNFAFMPELDEPWGYPMAVVLMVLSALLPLWWFKRKGWL